MLHLGKRLVSYSQSPERGDIQMEFQDGTTARCDVLVGCDGIRSSVRPAMYAQLASIASARGEHEAAKALRSYMPPKFSGAVVYRCMIQKDKLPAKTQAHPAFNSHAQIIVSTHAPVCRSLG